ncbi:MAG: hypothetical protein A2X22_14450 [Bacteroidetes bacterium GWF2_49_14]|nr:MAG: hypothetical protein A2X22_14450 [Bacteroidetes bacterium GWF2_49_14]
MCRTFTLLIQILLFLMSSSLFGQDLLNFRKTDAKSGKSYIDINSYVKEQGYKHKTMKVPPAQVNVFPGVSGPTVHSLIPAKKRTSWKKYQNGGTNRLCLFLKDTNSLWLGLVHGLEGISIPFKITTDIREAIRHDVVMVYPTLTSRNMDLNTFLSLRDFATSGGTLIAFDAASESLSTLFGFKTFSYSSKRDRIILETGASDLVSFAVDPLEKEIRIGNLNTTPDAFHSCGYSGLEYQPLALFNDGTAAITRKIYNHGAAYCFGLDLGLFTLITQNNLDSDYQNTYVNGFEPTLDVLYLIIKNIYLKSAKVPVYPGSVPSGKKVSVLITHDVDTKAAMKNSLLYGELERSNGIKATYYLQTKYIRDGQDESFFNYENIPYMIALKGMGAEIASHSVSHTPFFQFIPVGVGNEKYPDYQPYYVTNFSTFNETLLGEFQVSKFLLDYFFNQNTISFRSGYLGQSIRMYPALIATGYSYSSCVTANDVLTHMPFRTFYDDLFDSEVEVYEFPITIEDEVLPPMNERLSSAIFLTDKIARYGGMVNILIHPNETVIKYEFQKGYIEHFKDIAWFGTQKEYGNWWVARAKMQIDAVKTGNKTVVTIYCPDPIYDLPLMVPTEFHLVGSTPVGIEYQIIPGGLLFSKLEGQLQLHFEND